MTMQPQRPPRVQSVLHGPTEASCLQQAITDGEQAAAHGYVPIWQGWSRENDQFALTILYEVAQVQGPTGISPADPYAPKQPQSAWQAPPVGAAQPTAWTPPPVAAAQPTAWQAPPVGAAQPTAWTPPPVAAAQPTAWQAPPVQPPLTPRSPTFSSRVVGAIVSIIVIVVVWLVYGALNRALY